MKGYIARTGDRDYAVIYEGTDPITGRERRRWHPVGTDRNEAERLAADLEQRRQDDGCERSSLTVERLYADLADNGRADGAGSLNPKTIVEIHMILRRALDDAIRRGLLISNPARIAHAPKRRPLSSPTSRVWSTVPLNQSATGSQLRRLAWKPRVDGIVPMSSK